MMTRERGSELVELALAAGDGSVSVPGRELIDLLAELEQLRSIRDLDDNAERLARRLYHLAPYIARAATALESARGVMRQVRRISDDGLAATAEAQYAATVAEIDTTTGGSR